MKFRNLALLTLIACGSLAALGLNRVQSQVLRTQVSPVPSPAPTANPIPIKPDVPYVPTPEAAVMEMLKLAQVGQNDIVYDLGSGDGRLVITAVEKFGAKRGVGVEINPGLVKTSQANAEKAGVSDRTQFLAQDLFNTDIREASVVTLYLLPDVNLRLRPKLLSELKPGTRIVSHSFSMGDWKPDKTVLVSGTTPQRILYYWVVPAKVEGTWQGNLEYTPGNRAPYTLKFSQQFQQVKGNASVNGQTINLSDVKLEGDRISFSRTETIGRQKVIVQFNGRIQGNTLNGTADLQAGAISRSFPIVARRVTSAQP